MKKTVIVDIKFDDNLSDHLQVGKTILEALDKKIKIDNFRYTYVESYKYGIAEMPRDLMLAGFMSMVSSFCWYIPQNLSGKYKFVFEK